MGNEMGNNNTSGLREEDNIVEDKHVQRFDHADDLKGQNHIVPATLDKESQGEVIEDNEEHNTKIEGTKSPEDVARTAYEKEQNHELVVSEDDEKEEDSDMIVIDKETFMQESGYAEEGKEQDILVPASKDKNTQGNETGSASLEQDGLASSRIEDRKCVEKEQDNRTILEVDDIHLKEAASTDETNGEARLVPAGGDESSHGTETGLVFNGHDGMEYPCTGNQKHDEKEEDITINAEAEEQSSQEAASADVLDIQSQLLAVVEDKATNGNETDLVSSDPEGTADLHGVEEDNNMIPVDKGKSMQEAGYAEHTEGKDHLFPAAEDKNTCGNEMESTSLEHDGLVSPRIKDQEHVKTEQDTSPILDVEEIPSKEAASTNETSAEACLVLAGGEESTHRNETETASLEHDGLASSYIEDQEHNDKKQDTSTDEIPSKEDASIDETNAGACLVPAGGDGSTHGTETRLVFGYRDGMEYPCADNQKDDEKEEDITINDKAKEQSSQETASTDVLDTQGHLHAVVKGKATNGNETELISSDPEGTTDCHDDHPKEHEKEEDDDMIPVDTEKDTEEAGYAEEEKGLDHLVPATEVKYNRGNVTESASLEHDSLVSPHNEDWKRNQKEQETSRDETPLKEGASPDETIAGAGLVPAGGDESTRGHETGMVFSDNDDKEEDISINDEADKQSSQEAAITDVLDRQDQLLAVGEDRTTTGTEKDLVSSVPEGIVDLHSDNPKEHENEVNNTNAEPQEKPLAKDNIEEKDTTFPAAEGKDCNNALAGLASDDPVIVGDTLDNQILEGKEQRETELDPPAESTDVAKPSDVVGEGSEIQPDSLSKKLEDPEMQKESNYKENLSGITHDFENRNFTKEEDEETSNSIYGAASLASLDSMPQEPKVVLEPEECEFAEIHTEQLVLESNGQLKSEDAIIPSLTSRDQENSVVLDYHVSTDTVESVFPDRSPETGKERNEFLVEELPIKEVSSEEKFEVKDGDEPGNDVGAITTSITYLPVEFGAKCNGELQGYMNSIKNDSPELQVEAVLYDETHNILVEVSESEDKGIDLSQEGTSIKEEYENGTGKQSQSKEESIEKPNGQSKADDQNGFSSQFLQAKILENGHLVDATINHQNEQQNDSQQEVQLVTDSADTFLMDQRNKEPEEMKIIEEMVQNKNDSNLIENDTPRRENGEQKSLPHPHDPIEQAEAFLIPSPFLQALPEKQMHESVLESKKFENSNGYSMAEVKQESSGEIPIAEVSFVNKNLTEKIAVANGDYMGRLSIESNPDNKTINAEMRKSPSFDLDLRIDARAEDHSDQTPLLYQDKATIESFSSQAYVTDHGKPVANTENGEIPSHKESMAAEEKTVTLERSETEKSRTPFLGFLKEDEEADNNMLLNPMEQDNDSATKKTTTEVSVSAKDVTSATRKGKVKRKPRTSLFGTCMCCATV